ncbi:MAG: DnaJ family domain-containing protein [Rhodospirillaceae bacterium]
MKSLESLVEERIRDAQARGEFDDLPGTGAPLELDDDRLVPEDLRVAYRVLKNAGFVPPEVEALRDMRALEAALQREDSPDERLRLLARMNAVLLRTPLGRRRGSLRIEAAYFEKIAEKLARGRASASTGLENKNRQD